MENQPKSSKSGSKNKLVVIIVAIVAIIGILFFMSTAQKGKPTKVANNFLDLLSQENIADAYAMTSTEFQKTVPQEGIKGFVEQNPILKNFEKVSFSEKVVEDKTARLTGTLTGREPAAGKTANLRVILVKEDNKWKVYSLTFTNPETTK